MQNQQFKVEGFAELFKAMDDLAQEVGKGKTDRIWKKSMAYAIAPVFAAAKQRAPVDSGQLQDHVYMKVQRPQGRDKASASYRGEMFLARVTVSPKRDDSIKHTTITRKGKERVTYTNRPVALSKEFGSAGNAPKPFLRPALENNISTVVERLGKAVFYELTWGKYASKG